MRGMHLKEQAMLDGEGPEELLDLVQLVEVALARQEGLAIDKLRLQRGASILQVARHKVKQYDRVICRTL